MAGSVKPYSVFEKTIERSRDLIALRKSGVAGTENDDLTRSAVLISVAAFDRYFTAKYCDVLIPHLKSGRKISQTLFDRLSEAGLDAQFALELINSDRPFRKIRTIVQKSLSLKTTHREEIIDELFEALSLKELSTNAEKKTKKKTLRSSFSTLVDLRNEIAHEGHVKLSGEPRKIDADRVEKRIEKLVIFVKSCDEIIDNKYGKTAAVSG